MEATLAFQVLRFIWSEKRPLHKVVKQQYKHDSEKWGHKEVIHEPVPHQWAGKRLPHMSPGGRGHSVAVFSKVFPEQVDGFWIPLHPGLLSGPAWSPFTWRPEGLISWWARACEWSGMELCVRLQQACTKYPAPLSLTGLWCWRKTRRITRDVMSCVKSGLGPHPDTLISTGGGKGWIIIMFQGKDPNTHWELFGYTQAWMWPSLLFKTQPAPPGHNVS